jgi:hypothetical protein
VRSGVATSRPVVGAVAMADFFCCECLEQSREFPAQPSQSTDSHLCLRMGGGDSGRCCPATRRRTVWLLTAPLQVLPVSSFCTCHDISPFTFRLSDRRWFSDVDSIGFSMCKSLCHLLKKQLDVRATAQAPRCVRPVFTVYRDDV